MEKALEHYNEWVRRSSSLSLINTYYWGDIAEEEKINYDGIIIVFLLNFLQRC